MKNLLTFLSIFFLSFALLACSSSSDTDEKVKADKEAAKAEKTEQDEKKKKEEEEEARIPICPQVAILRELEVMKDYGREKPDPEQLVAQTKLMGIDGDCSYEDTGIDVKFDLSMVAQRGPRLGGLHTEFPYFIAVVDPDDVILNKENLTVKFGFASDSNVTMNTEALHIFIPLDKKKRATGPLYRVLAEFQLPKDKPDNSSEKPSRESP